MVDGWTDDGLIDGCKGSYVVVHNVGSASNWVQTSDVMMDMLYESRASVSCARPCVRLQ